MADRHQALGQVRAAAEFVDLGEVASRLGMSRAQCRWLVRRGQFCPVHRISNQRILVRLTEFEDWLRSTRVEPANPVKSVRNPEFERALADLRRPRTEPRGRAASGSGPG